MPGKLTDKEIVKALECCKSDTTICNECPYDKIGECIEKMCADSIDLINRLQGENERWRKNCDDLYKEMSERLKAELKIERRLAKAEAYKEFAERVKKLPYYPSYTNLHKAVDNLLKELVGDSQ